MPILLRSRTAKPSGSNPAAVFDWIMDALTELLEGLRGLVTLNGNVRETRSLEAERAVVFFGAIVVDTGPSRLRDLYGDVLAKTFTTALIQFDSAAGAGRWRADGPDPVSAATAVAGMPIAAGGLTLTIVGSANIQNFSVIGEPAATLNMSVTLYQ